MTITDPIPARLAALKTMTGTELKKQWRALFDTEPPLFNRRYIETRLGYRIQELTYGGLKPETVRRLQELGEQLDGGNITTRRIRSDLKPIIGTRLIREWQGTAVERQVLLSNAKRAYQERVRAQMGPWALACARCSTPST